MHSSVVFENPKAVQVDFDSVFTEEGMRKYTSGCLHPEMFQSNTKSVVAAGGKGINSLSNGVKNEFVAIKTENDSNASSSIVELSQQK